MQLKGLVKLCTAVLIVVSLYQISFTFVAQSIDKKLHDQAKRTAEAQHPHVSSDSLSRFTDIQFDHISDSLQGQKVYNLLFKKYTYQDVKSKELNLGLDLQGGMSVTLEVSLDEMVQAMSNSPKDVTLNNALKRAHEMKITNTQENFITLFGRAYAEANPSGKLAYLFSKSSEKEITINSTNDEVLSKIKKEADDAVKRTYGVLQTRIDKFGVMQPNINLDANKGIITVELAGVRNPERVREILQSTAKLQFFETYANEEIYQMMVKANDALAASLNGVEAKPDTSAKSGNTAAAEDTTKNAIPDTSGSLKSLLAKGDTGATKNAKGKDALNGKQDEQAKKYPLFKIWTPNTENQNKLADAPCVGFLRKSDTAKFREYMNMDAVRSKFPPNVQFMFGAETKEARLNPDAPIMVYAIKLAPGGGAELEGDRVTNAGTRFDQLTGKPEVTMDMDIMGAQVWKKMTGRNKDKFVAVTLDERVYSAPRVNNEIADGSTSISGGFTIEEATDLANILKSGKLPAPAHIVQEQVVGPTLGAENILAGEHSLMVAFVVIFVLMLVYYNTAGIVANIALILNLFFTFGILAMGATLTMPGIAGLVLTIGMAVDTNVIVFERIKEELAAGLSYSEAIKKGYGRSYAPVLDGHITQFLTAFILFMFGLGPVKGFATTQMIGLALSVFCGLLVSRLVTDMYTKSNRHFTYFTGLSKSIFKKAHFKFIELRKYTYIISAFVFMAGIGSFFYGYDYGVEFAGGRSYDVHFANLYKTEDVKMALKPTFGDYPVVKTIGTDNDLNITTTYRINEQGKTVSDTVLQKLHEGLVAGGFIAKDVTFETFKAKNLKKEQTVLPTISADLKRGAIMATALSLLAIFLYILLRFRKWQYSLGTIIALLHDVCITLAVFSFFRGRVPFALEIDQHFIAAVLTVIGFSMNDTVIVFDRVREYFRKTPNGDKKEVINRAINDTLSRTIMTSLTVFLTILILFIFGGEATKGFAFAMLIGVITGTYSSIFVAAPVLVDMDRTDNLKNEIDKEARIEELKKLA